MHRRSKHAELSVQEDVPFALQVAGILEAKVVDKWLWVKISTQTGTLVN